MDVSQERQAIIDQKELNRPCAIPLGLFRSTHGSNPSKKVYVEDTARSPR
jgi:hypothetical protein